MSLLKPDQRPTGHSILSTVSGYDEGCRPYAFPNNAVTDSDPLDLVRVQANTFLRHVASYPELESTNSEAVLLSKEADIETPLLVITDRQTAGRGRGSNSWWSHSGSLTFTLLLRLPTLPPDDIGSISLTIGVAICQALEKIAPTADIALKWPNDVYLNGKKCVGILVECPSNTATLSLAIGIGMNVNNSFTDAAPELRETATSLIDMLEEPCDRTEVMIECLRHIEQRIDDHVHRRETLIDQWRAYSFLTGQTVEVEAPGQVIGGTCIGIDEDGALLLEEDGRVQRCMAGHVRVAR